MGLYKFEFEFLVSGAGLGVQSLQSTRIQSTHPPWVVYTGGGWVFFSLFNYLFLKQAE
jgi:hypothetical protein